MSFINYDTKEINFKIVFVGPAQSGKTTSLAYIFEKTKGKSKSKMVRQEANERTLFFDFIPLFLKEIGGLKTRFHLYTVPGQVLYEESRNLILKGVDAIAFVANSAVEDMESNLRSLEGLKKNLTEQGLSIDEIPIIFLYNKRDIPHPAHISEMRKLLNPNGAPDFETIATNGQNVFESFKKLALMTLEDFVKSN